MILSTDVPAVEFTEPSITAHDFACPVSTEDRAATFGTNRAMTVNALRRLADRIERQEVYLNSVRVLTLARADNFTTTSLRLVLNETLAVKAPENK